MFEAELFQILTDRYSCRFLEQSRQMARTHINFLRKVIHGNLFIEVMRHPFLNGMDAILHVVPILHENTKLRIISLTSEVDHNFACNF